MKRLVNGIFVLLGFVCMGLGIVGTVVPLLPTVPFLIGAALCFAKGSQRFHRWFIQTKVYQAHLQTFVEDRSMTRKKKIRALGLMTVMIGFAAWWMPRLELRLMLVLIILFNYWYFAARIRTISEEEEKERNRRVQILGEEAGESDGQ